MGSKSIGFILDFFHGYQETLWNEAVRSAGSAGISLVTFVGQSMLRGTASDVPATNKVFDLAFTPWIDSFMLSGSTLGSFISKAELMECLAPFRKRPCVSIGPCGEGFPAVVIENRSGIKALVEHLAKDHGRRRIAFISGPDGSFEAAERLASYRAGLESAALPYDAGLVYVGNFWYNTGEDAIRDFLDSRRADFDAVAAANDYMALGALRELVRRGKSVPGDVAVVGYDDVLEAECERPALTTVRQPLLAQMDAAIRALSTGEAAPRAPLATSTMIRRSCGCQSQGMELAGRSGRKDAGPASAAEIASEAVRAADLPQGSEPIVRTLADSCLAGAKNGDFERFYADAESAIYKSAEKWTSLSPWHDVLSVLRYSAYPSLGERGKVASFEGVLGRLRVLVCSLETGQHKIQRSKDNTFQESLGVALKAVGKAESLEEVGRILGDQMKTIGIRSFYFALKSDISPGCGPVIRPDEAFTLYAAYSDDADLLAGKGSRSYPARELLPADILPRRRFNFIALPVSFGLDFYGVALFEPGPMDGSTYVRIGDQVGSSVQSALLIAAEKRSEKTAAARTERIVSLARPMTSSIIEASKIASDEADAVEGVGESARVTRSDISATEEAIAKMAERARKMKEFIKVIEEISETISLLGLNAAIEAARAGKMGRGFNVIASEIRKLAESTRINAESIGKMLGELSADADESVSSARRSASAFSSLDADLAKVIVALKDVSSRMDGLSASSEELIRSM
jgi:phosphoserine phosphatase RsbU/P